MLMQASIKLQYTRTFRVPPDFLSSASEGGGAGGGDVVDDPFATGGDGGGSSLQARKTAKEILMAQGITFPDGASAFFNPRTSTLVARNTQNNMEQLQRTLNATMQDVHANPGCVLLKTNKDNETQVTLL